MEVGEIWDFLTALPGLLLLVFFAGLIIWESVGQFWHERTWREEGGRFVRDYSALRASLKTAMSALFHVSIIVVVILGFLRWSLGPYLFGEFIGRAFWGGLTGFLIAYCALSIFQHHRRADRSKLLTCWQVAALTAFIWAILHFRGWPDD